MALTDKLTAIANAIRAKTGKTESLTLEQMPTEIESIATGGGSSDDVRYVTFRNEATGEEFVKPVATGDDCVDVVAKGLWAKPTKPSDAQYDYTFSGGWSSSDGGTADADILKNITEDKTVYPVFVGVSIVKSGACGESATWRLNADGVLTVAGEGDVTPQTSASGYPWYSSKSDIVKVVFEVNVPTRAIQNYTGVTSITLTDTVTRIDGYAFFGCAGLKNINIGSGVTSIPESAFRNCQNVTSVYIADENAVYSGNGNCIIQKETGTILVGFNSSMIPTDGSAISIGENAFQGRISMTNITIPDCVTSIGQNAFNSCTGLKSVTIGNGVISIGTSAFASCTGLTSVTIGSGVTNIGDTVFYSCKLTSITIPGGVNRIGKNVFGYNGTLNSVTFENADGWWVSTDSAATTGIAVDVSDPATNVTHFMTTYKDYYWNRSA